MDNITALKNLYVALGGSLDDVSEVTLISEMIDAISKIVKPMDASAKTTASTKKVTAKVDVEESEK